MKIQDNYPEGKKLWFNDFYNDDDSIFFSAGNFNGLYKYCLKDKRLLFLGKFKDEYLLGKQLYGSVYRYENQLIFIPLSACSIGIFNLKDESFESVSLPVPGAVVGMDCKFLNSVLYNESIFAFPGYATYIIEYNINEKKIIVHSDWYKEYINKWEKRSNLLFHFDMVQINDMVYIPSGQYNGWFQYCLSNNEYMFREVSGIDERINTISYDGKYFWSSTQKELIILDLDGAIVDQIDIDTVYGVQESFYHSFYDKGYLWLFFSQSSRVLKIACNHYKEEFETITYCAEEKRYTNYEYHTVDFVKKKKNEYYFLCRGNRGLYKVVGGNVENFLDTIEDTTEYANKCISNINLYIDKIRCQKKTDENLHRTYSVNDRTYVKNKEFTEVIKEDSLEEVKNNYAWDIGSRIYRETV